MEYDAYGRLIQGRGNEGYFDPADTPSTSDYSRHYISEQRDRDSLNPPRWNHAHQRYSPPITNETLERNRMDRSVPVDKGSENVSPELIAAITEKVKKEVMEHLKQKGNVEDPARAPPMQRQRSRESASTSSPPPPTRRVYTPPSPAQAPPRSSYPPPPPMEPPRSMYPPPPPESARAPYPSERVDSTRKPYPPSPSESTRNPYPSQPTESARSPPASPLDKPSGVRFSDRGPPRPMGGGRSYSTAELSAVDQKWGRLFDQGKPTQRLGQFLRGLANHIIEDFEPKKSIVVTPVKMAEFYRRHPTEKEPHALLAIFQSQSHEHISVLYQDLGCQHHLVQEQASMPCTVPSLTPLGFAHWMTLNILAYPEEEWKRLEKVVLAMPVNADGEMIDGKPERLPKQISRYLLPEVEEWKSKKLLDGAIKDFLEDLGTTPRRKKSIASPPELSRQSSTSHSRRSSQSRRGPVEIPQDKRSPTTAKPIERERAPYSGAPSSDVSSSTDDSVKIERDRQPYISQPGNGRVYDNLNNTHNRPNRANSTSRTREPEIPESRRDRTNSDARRESYIPSRSSNRRTSSPPIKNFSNSTPVDINSSSYNSKPISSPNNFATNQNTYSPNPYRSSNPSFPPPPSNERREQYSGRRIPEEESSPRFTNEFNSPREAEKWDRYEDARAASDSYDRGSVSVDPRDTLPLRGGAPTEDYYRESKPRTSGYDDFATRRY